MKISRSSQSMLQRGHSTENVSASFTRRSLLMKNRKQSFKEGFQSTQNLKGCNFSKHLSNSLLLRSASKKKANDRYEKLSENEEEEEEVCMSQAPLRHSETPTLSLNLATLELAKVCNSIKDVKAQQPMSNFTPKKKGKVTSLKKPYVTCMST